uniref:Uncharacterized protein n=1 Tax=Palpitomonas bilix TaxID=652834 RepID=A0A7S3G892_9EUKA|mmetsp:Transcript_34804/g.90255  ORF Transcript_34804/g.90255 Transcript_34804/m.90255 type:complete len:294 (+) Transcript_34804:2-883(+)
MTISVKSESGENTAEGSHTGDVVSTLGCWPTFMIKLRYSVSGVTFVHNNVTMSYILSVVLGVIIYVGGGFVINTLGTMWDNAADTLLIIVPVFFSGVSLIVGIVCYVYGRKTARNVTSTAKLLAPDIAKTRVARAATLEALLAASLAMYALNFSAETAILLLFPNGVVPPRYPSAQVGGIYLSSLTRSLIVYSKDFLPLVHSTTMVARLCSAGIHIFFLNRLSKIGAGSGRSLVKSSRQPFCNTCKRKLKGGTDSRSVTRMEAGTLELDPPFNEESGGVGGDEVGQEEGIHKL